MILMDGPGDGIGHAPAAYRTPTHTKTPLAAIIRFTPSQSTGYDFRRGDYRFWPVHTFFHRNRLATFLYTTPHLGLDKTAKDGKRRKEQ